MNISPGASRDSENARLTPRAPGVPGGMDHDTAFLGGNLVGREGSGLDEARGIEPGEGSLQDRDRPIGSALAAAHGRDPRPTDEDLPGDAERAATGRADDLRSARADGNPRQSRTGGLE